MKIFHRNKLKNIFAILVLAEIIIVIVYFDLLSNFNKNLGSSNSEAAVILFHSFNNDTNTNLSSVTESRIITTLDLYNDNKIDQIICVGGYRKDRKFTGSELMARYLTKKYNLPDSIIFYDSTSFDTIINVKNALTICKTEEIESITFVSDDYHLMRVSYLMKELNRNNIKYSFCVSNKLSERTILDQIVIINKEAFVYLLYNILSTETYLRLLQSVR